MKTLTTTIEIDEVETNIEVIFIPQFGEVIIEKITDVDTGDAICPDFFERYEGLVTSVALDRLYNEMHELVANEEFIPTENHNV